MEHKKKSSVYKNKSGNKHDGELNGYGLGTTDAETNANATMAFVTEGLNKVLKINNICDSVNLSKCGISNKITNMADSKISPLTFGLMRLPLKP